MVKIIFNIGLILLSVLGTLETKCQIPDYFSNDPVWKVSVSYPPDWADGYELIYYINGDSLIDGMIYHKVYERSYNPNINQPEFDGFRMLVRQQERQVYLKQNELEEELLDDYSGEVGDIYWRTGYEIVSIDSVEINGQYHRKIKDGLGYESIEGIGYQDTPIFNDWTPVSPPDYGLGCYSQFGESITIYFEEEDNFAFIPNYDNCDFEIDFSFSINELELSNKVSIYPNPTSDKTFIESSSSPINSVHIHSQSGKLVYSDLEIQSKSLELDLSKLESGLYFVQIIDASGAFTEKLVKE